MVDDSLVKMYNNIIEWTRRRGRLWKRWTDVKSVLFRPGINAFQMRMPKK